MISRLRSSPAWPAAVDEVRRAAPYLDPRDLDAIGAMLNPHGIEPDARLVRDLAASLFSWVVRVNGGPTRAADLPQLSRLAREMGPQDLTDPAVLAGVLALIQRQSDLGFEAAEDATRPIRERALARPEARRRVFQHHATVNALVDSAFAGTPPVFFGFTLPRNRK